MDDVATGPGWELRLGRWQDVLRDVDNVDSLITDPPYTERTIKGFVSGTIGYGKGPRGGMPYGPVSREDIDDLCVFAAKACRLWFVAFNDHIGWYWLQESASSSGMYTFAPVIWRKTCPVPRLMADGPDCSCEHILVARQKVKVVGQDKKHRYGHYDSAVPRGDAQLVVGAKPVDLMRAIVRDYSRPGDLVCDPYAGSGTTLLAAVIEGRRAIGAEMDRGRFDMAVRRLREGHTPNMFGA